MRRTGMAKAINWPEEFRDEILSENTESRRIAVRLGSIYYDNGYYTDNEVIDIRINHKVTRKAVISGEPKLLKIKEISDEDMSKYKKSMPNKPDLIKFLSENYNKQVNEETEVTLITYKNLDIVPAKDDDPHM